MEFFFTGFSGLFIVWAYGMMMADAYMGKTRPHRTTWFVWMVSDGVMAASTLMEDEVTISVAIMPIVWFIGAIGMFCLSIKYGERGKLDSADDVVLTLSAFSLLLWYISGNPAIAIVGSVSAACIGGVPTIIQAWQDPSSESLKGWILMLAATGCSMIAIPKWTFISGFLPIMVALLQIVIITPLALAAIRGFLPEEDFEAWR